MVDKEMIHKGSSIFKEKRKKEKKEKKKTLPEVNNKGALNLS